MFIQRIFKCRKNTRKNKKEYKNSTNYFFYMIDVSMSLKSLLLFQTLTNAQALLMTVTQMRLVLTQEVHSLVAATKDIPGMVDNAWVCYFWAVNGL